MSCLKGQIAIVTGASGGIGESIVRLLSEKGVIIAFCGRNNLKIEALEKELTDKGRCVSGFAFDLRNEKEVSCFVSNVYEKWGHIDLLINNAGLGYNSPLIDGNSAEWKEILDLNVLSLCLCTKEVLKFMIPKDRGHIVHMSSMSAHRVLSDGGMYSASKFAVRSLAQGLRFELKERKSKIRVSSISPGFVKSGFAKVYHHGDEIAAEKEYNEYKVLEPEDIARCTEFLLESPEHVEIHDILIRPTEQTL